jgi:predicted DNA-binding protein (UPF0251 family)
MPRKKAARKMVEPPKFSGFTPYGALRAPEGAVVLLFEEYEAIKLADYALKTHKQASALMGVSRATFARIYESARRKIARALVEGLELTTRPGNARFDQPWFWCTDCNNRFSLKRQQQAGNCPSCSSENLKPLLGEA